jgi:hypothetical protein
MPGLGAVRWVMTGCASANGITQTAISPTRQNASRTMCALIAGLIFTLVALLCVSPFYSNRVKDVETFFCPFSKSPLPDRSTIL